MAIDLKHRAWGTLWNKIFTVLGGLTGFAAAAGQYLDMIPEQYRSQKWYGVAAALVALGLALGKSKASAAPAEPPKGCARVGLLAAMAAALMLVLPGAARAGDQLQPTGILPEAGACFGAVCIQPALATVPVAIDLRSGALSRDITFGGGYGITFARLFNERFRPGIDFLFGIQTGGNWSSAIMARLGMLRLGPVLVHANGVNYMSIGLGAGI